VRESGPIPPLLRKRTDGDTGWTCLGPLPLLPFRLHVREGGVDLRYRGLLGFLVDRLTPAGAGTWSAIATCAGFRYGRFRLEPIDHGPPELPTPASRTRR
jgi:hypothetical protein